MPEWQLDVQDALDNPYELEREEDDKDALGEERDQRYKNLPGGSISDLREVVLNGVCHEEYGEPASKAFLPVHLHVLYALDDS